MWCSGQLDVRLLLLCGAMSVLATSAACNRAPPEADAAQADEDTGDSADVEAAGAADAAESLDGGAADAKDHAPGDAIATSDPGDVLPMDAPGIDATDTFGSLPDVAGLVSGPYCSGGNALPKPLTKCDVEGQWRCTGYGESSVQSWGPNAPDWITVKHGICRRPYRVRCTKTGGHLRWKLSACPKPPNWNECNKAWQKPTCQEGPKGVSCCPSRCLGNTQGVTHPSKLKDVSGYAARICDDEDAGKILCEKHAAAKVVGCGYLSQPPFNTATNKLMFAKCADQCKGCRYWFHTEECLPMSCPKHFGPAPQKCLDSGKCFWPPDFHTKCLWDNGKPRCPKDCKEAGAKNY